MATIVDLFTRLPENPDGAEDGIGMPHLNADDLDRLEEDEWADHTARIEASRTAPDRNETIAIIRAELRRRTGRSWSVTGGSGTSWGWITVNAPPARRGGKWGPMCDADRATLAEALGLPTVSTQGESIPAGSDYRAEYVARARGEKPTVTGRPYWD